MTHPAAGTQDWFGLFQLYFMVLLIAAVVFLITLVAIFSKAKLDPTPDNVPYDIPLRRSHQKGEGGLKIQWLLLISMNVFGLMAALLLYGKMEIPQVRMLTDVRAMIAAAVVWEALLIGYVYVGKIYTASLTIDDRGVQMERWGGATTYLWKDISDALILYTYSKGGTPIPHLRILRQGQTVDPQSTNFDEMTDIRYPGLNIYRLRETVLKGMQIWGHKVVSRAIASSPRDDASGPAPDVDSDAKRAQRARRNIWIGMVLVPLAFSYGFFSHGRFIPDRGALNWGSIAIGGAVAATVFFALRSVKTTITRDLRALMILVAGVGLVLVWVVFFGALEFIIGIPDVYTRFYGKPATRQVTVVQWRPASHGRHSSCAGVSIAEIPALLGSLCLDRQVAPGTSLVLHGRQSILGFHVDAVE